MAKISNIPAYPHITPVADDYLVLTDTTDANKTKTVTVQSIADFVDGEVTLQEVLDASDPLNIPPTAVAIGNITLTGEFASPAGTNVTIKTLGLNDDIELFAGATSGSVMISGAGIAGNAEDIEFVSSVGDIDLNAFGVNGDIKIKAGDKAIIAGNGSSYATQPAGTTMVYNQNDDVLINASGGEIKIGGAYGNRPTGIDIGPTDGDIDIWAFSAGSKINLTGTGGIDSLSVHNFQFDNGITLAGVAGVAGEVIASAGPGAPLAWSAPLSLLSLLQSNVFTGDATNTPTATDKILIDLAPAAGFPDITIGTTPPAPATTFTLQQGLYYADVMHPIGDANLSYGYHSLSLPAIIGTQNTGLGINALEHLQIGNENTSVGYRAGIGIQDTSLNTAVGSSALSGPGAGSIGDSNTAIGGHSMESMNSNTANFNVGVGTFSLGGIASGIGNIGIGHNAGLSITTGNSNIAIGMDAMLLGALAATGNVVIGDSAAPNIASSTNNTLIGTSSAASLSVGNDNVLVGALTDCSLNAIGSVAIGNSSIVGGAATAVGQGTFAADQGTALGNTAIAQDIRCVALGDNATAQFPAAPFPPVPVINISLWSEMTTSHVFPDNTAALAAGLHTGDLYCVDPTTIMGAGALPLPAIGGPGGPAIIAVVYAM